MPDRQKCFAGNQTNMVTMANGKLKYIEDVVVGDKVMVMRPDGTFLETEVHILSHRNPEREGDFYEINTDTKRVTLSDLHYLKVKRNDEVIDCMAKDVQVGDELFAVDDNEKKMETVLYIEVVQGKGIFAPFTKDGNLIVNDIAVSCYSTVKPEIAHTCALPLRVAYDVTPAPVMNKITTCNGDGKPYVMAAASRLVQPFISK